MYSINIARNNFCNNVITTTHSLSLSLPSLRAHVIQNLYSEIINLKLCSHIYTAVETRIYVRLKCVHIGRRKRRRIRLEWVKRGLELASSPGNITAASGTFVRRFDLCPCKWRHSCASAAPYSPGRRGTPCVCTKDPPSYYPGRSVYKWPKLGLIVFVIGTRNLARWFIIFALGRHVSPRSHLVPNCTRFR